MPQNGQHFTSEDDMAGCPSHARRLCRWMSWPRLKMSERPRFHSRLFLLGSHSFVRTLNGIKNMNNYTIPLLAVVAQHAVICRCYLVMVHVDAPTPLRRLLSDARPTWTEKDLAAVEEKLSRVGATTVPELADLLTHGLNKRLHAAGLKAFNSETLAALRSRVETESRSPHHKQATGIRQQEWQANPTNPDPQSKQEEQFVRDERPKTAHYGKEPVQQPETMPSFKQSSPSTSFGRAEALGETQLIKAVRQSDIRTVQYLLTHRSDPNEKDNFGETALMEAAGQGQAQICRILLENAANPACKSPSGLSATQLASEHQSVASLCCMAL